MIAAGALKSQNLVDDIFFTHDSAQQNLLFVEQIEAPGWIPGLVCCCATMIALLLQLFLYEIAGFCYEYHRSQSHLFSEQPVTRGESPFRG